MNDSDNYRAFQKKTEIDSLEKKCSSKLEKFRKIRKFPKKKCHKYSNQKNILNDCRNDYFRNSIRIAVRDLFPAVSGVVKNL